MGELILLLEKKGLIARRADPANKKALLLSLTRLGKTVCAKGDAHVRRIERAIFGTLSGPELAALRSMLSDAIATLRTDERDGHDTANDPARPAVARSTIRTPRHGANL